MLRGSYNARIDEKGRFKVPASFKRYLEERYGSPDYYVTSLDGECARIYPLHEWEEIERKLAEPPVMDPAKKKFLDRTNYWGQMQALDGQGRMLIPLQLRADAGLQGDVMVSGYLNFLEVWSVERFRQVRLENRPYTDEDHEAMARLGI
ncbi:MAG: division/cell wall cluster transcriptional repressor MraZ [Blastocatellia bacterium]